MTIETTKSYTMKEVARIQADLETLIHHSDFKEEDRIQIEKKALALLNLIRKSSR